MTLTRIERQLLANQHRILELLEEDEDDKAYHAMMKEVYHSGYEYEYFEYGVYDDDSTLSEELCKLVYEIINMYDDLYWQWENDDSLKSSIDNRDVIFRGFDLNDPTEGRMYSFAKFLIEDLNKFHETGDMIRKNKKELNSHGFGPGLEGYIKMLGRYKPLQTEMLRRGDNVFTVEEMTQIVEYYK